MIWILGILISIKQCWNIFRINIWTVEVLGKILVIKKSINNKLVGWKTRFFLMEMVLIKSIKMNPLLTGNDIKFLVSKKISSTYMKFVEK